MKKVFLLSTILIALAAPCYSQYDSSVNSIQTPGNDYLIKAKNKKTAAWIFLGGGAAFVFTGLLIGDSKNSSFDDAATGAVISGVGVLSMLGSIPLFISSSHYKHKARLGLSTQKTGIGVPLKGGGHITGVSLLIPIGK